MNPPPITLALIPDGVDSTRQTLRLMREYVRRGKKTPAVRQTALDLTNGMRQKDFIGEVKKLHAYVRDHIRYIRDIRNVETLHPPEVILELEQGDCDDKSILLASLLESIGHPTRFAAVAFRPGRYSHVYVETLIGNKWVPLETTEPVEIGWRPPNVRHALLIHN